MLWRTSYTPVVYRDPDFASPTGETLAIIGSGSLSASREVEVWWRLFEEDFPGEVIEVLPSALELESHSLRAPSRHFRIRFEDALVPKSIEIQTNRAFCVLFERGIARLLVIGPPTEEVWDEVGSFWRQLRT